MVLFIHIYLAEIWRSLLEPLGSCPMSTLPLMHQCRSFCNGPHFPGSACNPRILLSPFADLWIPKRLRPGVAHLSVAASFNYSTVCLWIAAWGWIRTRLPWIYKTHNHTLSVPSYLSYPMWFGSAPSLPSSRDRARERESLSEAAPVSIPAQSEVPQAGSTSQLA